MPVSQGKTLDFQLKQDHSNQSEPLISQTNSMTKNGITRLIIFCFVILVITVTISGVVILNSKYLTPVSRWILRETIFPSFTTDNVTYHFPLHLTLKNTRFTADSSPISTLDLWVNPSESNFEQLVFDTVLVEGAIINQQDINWLDYPGIRLNQLAAKNISYTAENGISFQGVDIQIKHPSWKNSTHIIPYGETQFFAEKILWKGETFQQVLFTGDYNAHGSLIHGLSFNWRQASIDLEAIQRESGWHILNATAENLRLSQPLIQQLRYKFADQLSFPIDQIERIDILRSQYTSPHIKFINCDLSITNVSLRSGANYLWEQNQAQLSLSADSIFIDNYQWIEPDLSMEFNPDLINIEDLNASLLQGNIHLSGSVHPDKINIRAIQLDNMKLFIEPDTVTSLPWLNSYFQRINKLFIDHLKIKNTQIIQLAHKPYWQLSGINIDASATQLAEQHQWGLWSGNLRASADSLSYDNIIASQGVVEMHSQENSWYLDRLFIPLKTGYIKSKGEWAYKEKGAPWKLELETDSMPLKLLRILPDSVNGLTDLSLTAGGLSGDSVILSHTISGKMKMNIRDGVMALNQQDLAFDLPTTTISGDRGIIKLPQTRLDPKTLNATISGEWNLIRKENGKLILSIKNGEKTQQYNLLTPQSSETKTETSDGL